MVEPMVRVTAGSAWARWEPDTDSIDGYMELRNSSNETIDLVSAASPDYRQVTLVTTTHEEGEVVKAGLDKVPVPGGSLVRLVEGDDRLQLDLPTREIGPGDQVRVDLRLSDGSVLNVALPVRASA